MKRLIIIALSGGSDSVVLLHHLLSVVSAETPQMRSKLIATHCNFHLRGDESDRDELFCRNLCNNLGVELLVKSFDTRQYMEEEHLSLELAARKLRYQWWEELAVNYENEGYEVKLAIGHHRDDSIETLLFHLMRGTGIKGLTGIPATNGRIIRPLSSWSRADILAYIEQNGLSFVTDSTNMEDDAMRNKIRNRLLPIMEDINPNAKSGIANTMHHLQFTKKLADMMLQQTFASTKRCIADNISWFEYTLPENLSPDTDNYFHYWSEQFAETEHSARRSGNLFYTEPAAQLLEQQKCPIREEILQTEEIPPFSPQYELFDAQCIVHPLTFRHWKEGDRIQPLGMTGTKLVSDLFTNAHYSNVRKATTWIVSDATGKIMWVAGLRTADWCKITKDTHKVIKLFIEQ